MNDQIDTYFALRTAILKYFGYQEGWQDFPLDDKRDDYWMLIDDETGVAMANTPFTENLIQEGKELYTGVIYYRERACIWRKEDLTLICIDTQCDGNIFLTILRNDREVKDEKLIELCEECW